MKTFKEVEMHLLTNGYKGCEMDKICGFLIGAGLKEPDYVMTIQYGEGTFDEFYAWYNDEPMFEEEETCDCPNCVLCGLMRDLAEKMERAETMEQKEYYATQLQFLIDEFCLDEEDSE